MKFYCLTFSSTSCERNKNKFIYLYCGPLDNITKWPPSATTPRTLTYGPCSQKWLNSLCCYYGPTWMLHELQKKISLCKMEPCLRSLWQVSWYQRLIFITKNLSSFMDKTVYSAKILKKIARSLIHLWQNSRSAK
jgi:hypothetical protein